MAAARKTIEIYLPDGSHINVDKDNVTVGRAETCDVRLEHRTVSRLHASISITDGRTVVSNLASSSPMTINGRPLRTKESNVLADGDTIQIGPFLLIVNMSDDGVRLEVSDSFAVSQTEGLTVAKDDRSESDALGAFWQKRSREKEDWGTRLRPTAKPVPGKAMYNWKPTGDLRRPYRIGLFVWAILVLGSAAVYAFYNYPTVYSPAPISNPHAAHFDTSEIANMSNSNSCTTCHAPGQPIENSCISCHAAEQFHATNTKAHEAAGITCTVCHLEHRGADFSPNGYAIRMCAECHNDNNKKLYNGKAVRTAHDGSYGYPMSGDQWTWQGVYAEVAEAVPEITGTATGDKDEQAKRSRHFHAIHVSRLTVPQGLKGDAAGLVSCSTCHKSFEPIDRITPRETCASCHMNQPGSEGRDNRFPVGEANCISCHVQHPFSGNRWREFLSDEAFERRRSAVRSNIERLRQ